MEIRAVDRWKIKYREIEKNLEKHQLKLGTSVIANNFSGPMRSLLMQYPKTLKNKYLNITS